MQIVDTAVPQDLQETIKGHQPLRRNSSLHMGLGIQRNIARKRKVVYGRYSTILPELQTKLYYAHMEIVVVLIVVKFVFLS